MIEYVDFGNGDGRFIFGPSFEGVLSSVPDPRPQGRIKDTDLLRRLHMEWDECLLCGESGVRLSLHHVLKNPRQDVREGLVMLCGDGVQGCHGLIEAHEAEAHRDLAWAIIRTRPDVVEHLIERLGEPGAQDWLSSRLRCVTKHG